MRDHSLFRFVVGALARFFSLITSIYKLNFVVSESDNCIDDQDSTARSIKATVQYIKRIRQSWSMNWEAAVWRLHIKHAAAELVLISLMRQPTISLEMRFSRSFSENPSFPCTVVRVRLLQRNAFPEILLCWHLQTIVNMFSGDSLSSS